MRIILNVFHSFLMIVTCHLVLLIPLLYRQCVLLGCNYFCFDNHVGGGGGAACLQIVKLKFLITRQTGSKIKETSYSAKSGGQTDGRTDGKARAGAPG